MSLDRKMNMPVYIPLKFLVDQSGIELLLGNSGGVASGDWRIANIAGTLRLVSTNDNFATNGTNRFSFTRLGKMGIGVDEPESSLHIYSGEEASLTDDGYIIIGDKDAHNMVIDQNEINTRNNGTNTSLYLQRHGGNIYTGSNGGNIFLSHGGGNTYTGYNGGNTYLDYGGGNTYTGYNGGNTYLADGGGKVSSGGSPLNAQFNISDDDFQVYVRNDEDDTNDWYIGASNESWAVGDDYLVFSPTSSSTASVLRLNTTTDNNGTTAPVAIASSGGHELLLDGNEIDANSALYINHNTNENTYINPTGGRVAVGNSSPWGMLHAKRSGSSPCFGRRISDNNMGNQSSYSGKRQSHFFQRRNWLRHRMGRRNKWCMEYWIRS